MSTEQPDQDEASDSLRRVMAALDWFVPAPEVTRSERDAARLLVGMLCFSTVATVVFLVLGELKFLHLPEGRGPYLVMLGLMGAGLVWMRQTGRYHGFSNLILPSSFVVCVYNALAGDGIADAAAPFIGATPVLAAVFRGPRLASGWLVVSWITLSALFAATPHTGDADEYGHLVGMLFVHLLLTTIYTASIMLALLGRTQALAEARRDAEESREAHQRAEQEAHAREQLLAVTSHELRTPLNGILGSLELMETVTDDPSVLELQAIAVRSSRTLNVLVNDILDHSRLEAGALPLDAVPFPIRSLLADVELLFAGEARRQGLSWRVWVDPELDAIWIGDPRRIGQIVNNLVGNALKFTDTGEVELRVERALFGLKIRVTDTGPGLDESSKLRIFEPFQQASDSTSRHYGGSGLGLAITQRLVRQMGGTLTVASSLGEGSTFSAHLPLSSSALEAVEEPHTGRLRRRSTNPDTRVLVFEDNPINQIVLDKMIKTLGGTMVLAEDARSGLELAVDTRWDLILMDCRMPEVDGFEATRILRARGVLTPIVAVTASATPSERAECFAAGMDAVLEKPLSLESLRSELLRWTRPE